MKINKIRKAVTNPLLLFAHLIMHFSKCIKSDKLYLKMIYYCYFREKLDFEKPKDFTQKIQCLKLLNNSALCTQMVDKYGVRELVKALIGEKYLIPLLGVWNSFDDIDFDSLPNKFVLKTTHDSGGIVICKDKQDFDYKVARDKLQKRLLKNYYWRGREYPYRNIKPRIIAEKFMIDESGVDLKDYKFFCFNGEPKLLFLASCRHLQKIPNFDYYDVYTHKKLPISSKGHPHSDIDYIDIPNYDEMIYIAKELSKGFPHLRVDLYNINGQIYFGELTFHHDGGFVPFYPKEWNIKLGEWIKL